MQLKVTLKKKYDHTFVWQPGRWKEPLSPDPRVISQITNTAYRKKVFPDPLVWTGLKERKKEKALKRKKNDEVSDYFFFQKNALTISDEI